VKRDDGKPLKDGVASAYFVARTPREAVRIAIANDRAEKSIPNGAVLVARLMNSRRSSVSRYVVTGHCESHID
jgi:hypothetical protein